MQVYVPLNTEVTYEVTQPFARTVAELLEQEHRALVVARMAKSLRGGKVFIDWSQNADHKTTVAAYSLRATRDRPFVSLPVWPGWTPLSRTRTPPPVLRARGGPEAARQGRRSLRASAEAQAEVTRGIHGPGTSRPAGAHADGGPCAIGYVGPSASQHSGQPAAPRRHPERPYRFEASEPERRPQTLRRRRRHHVHRARGASSSPDCPTGRAGSTRRSTTDIAPWR